MGHPPLSRRKVLAGLGSLAAAGALSAGAAGCAAPRTVGADKILLRYWHLFGGGDGVNMAAMLDRFGKEHPAIGLEAAQLEWGAPYYTKLGMAGAGGRAPEVAILHLARLTGFGPGRLLDPFDLGLLEEFGVRPADFPQEIWDRGTIDGKQYAVPLDTHPLVLYYQTEICEQAGLLGADGKLKTLNGQEEFYAALRAVKKVTGQPALVFETLGSDAVGPWRVFSALYSQTGGTLLNDDATRITIDDEKALRVLEFMRDVVQEGLAVRRTDYQGSVGIFNAGKTGFFLNGEWEVTTYKESGIPFSMTRIPGIFGRPTTQADVHSFVLPHQDARGGESNRAAHRFVAWMLKHSADWAAGGHVPAYTPTLSEKAYLDLEPQSEYRDVIDDVALDPPAWFAGSASAMHERLGAVFSSVATGARTPENALDEAKNRLQDLIDTPSPLGEGGTA
ncbi:extracellular solute-binding protein [Streptomyces sp. TRM66268-LWL]|uniref:Extracellular solute-binding protein n=1 Tax=Streptomyces polyasparticus TaxID=2767826 RepID=A0ABR7SAG2_9ACTN|nr:extracellular solute-binding protein [Streptomyces polyasparticus]MBC9712477.1 extracellular solute-binding protein [Streptomyces polyasparticus]